MGRDDDFQGVIPACFQHHASESQGGAHVLTEHEGGVRLRVHKVLIKPMGCGLEFAHAENIPPNGGGQAEVLAVQTVA